MHIPKVLVLGATGRIGTILRKRWPQDPGWGAIRDQVTWQTRQVAAGLGPGWCGLDPLRQPGALAQAASGQTVILCLAGVVTGRAPGSDLDDNVTLAEAAIRAAADTRARVILASSAAVYGNQAGVLDEAAVLAPQNAYGRAKATMEARGAALGAELGVAVTSLRIGNIAGIDAILGGWRPGFSLDQFDDGRTPRRSYIGMR